MAGPIVGKPPCVALLEEVAGFADDPEAPGPIPYTSAEARLVAPEDWEIITSSRGGMVTVVVLVDGDEYAEASSRSRDKALQLALDKFRRRRNEETNAVLQGQAPPAPAKPPVTAPARLTLINSKRGT